MVLQLKLCKPSNALLWLVSNVCIDLGLSLLVWIYHSLVSIYVCSLLVLVSLGCESVIIYREYSFKKQILDARI